MFLCCILCATNTKITHVAATTAMYEQLIKIKRCNREFTRYPLTVYNTSPHSFAEFCQQLKTFHFRSCYGLH